MTATVESLTAQKTALKTEFDGLVKKRIAATKSGKTFDGGTELQRIQSEIAVIEEALPVVQAEEDAEYERAVAEAKAKEFEELTNLAHEKRKLLTDSVGKAEDHAGKMVEALSLALTASTEIEEIYRQLGHRIENVTTNLEDRLSSRLLRKLSRIYSAWGRRSSFGKLSWGGEADRKEDWAAEEADQFERELGGVFNFLRMKKEGRL